ncbi:ABC transporter permease [candidate division KSB1 bacterium]
MKSKKKIFAEKPPVILEWFIRVFLKNDQNFEQLGDFDEIYCKIVKTQGVFRAVTWYLKQIIRLIPIALSTNITWRFTMILNYLKIAFRNMKRNKGYTFLNVSGLAVGMACCILIVLWVYDELSYDKFHANADRLYRVVQEMTASGKVLHVAATPAPLAAALKDEIPEILDAVRYFNAPVLLIGNGEDNFYEKRIAFSNSSILEMFDFSLLKGNPETALRDINSIVLSEKMSKKYFGGENPMGKTLQINNKYVFMISGVLKDLPSNSHLKFDFLIPFRALDNMKPDVGIRWSNLESWINFYYTYILVSKGTDINALNKNIENFIEEHTGNSMATTSVQPVLKIHLYSDLVADVEGNGNITYVYIFSIIAFFILLTACINFMNLSTAQSVKRVKEVGIRKISGAKKAEIVRQFLGESVIMSFISLIIAAVIVYLFMPVFNNISGKELSFNFTENPVIFAVLITSAVLTGIISGTYPAIFLSSCKPVKVVNGAIKSGPKSIIFRRVLVVIQFSLSVSLIIATSLVHKQLNFIQNSNLGFDRDHIIYANLGGETAQKYSALKSELEKNDKILGVTAANQLPTKVLYSITGADWAGKDPNETLILNFITVEHDFINTLNMKIIDGRAFSKEFSSDETTGFILNEEAAALMGEDSPVGKQFSFFGRTGTVTGVAENFHFDSFYEKVKPLAILYSPPDKNDYLMIKLKRDNISENMDFIEKTWKRIVPSYPFDYAFLDDDFNRIYSSEQRMGTIFNYFTFLTIFIAVLGMIGLSSFMASRRIKEFGIRKVLGASGSNIILLFSKELLALIILSNFIAWPLSYYFMNNWLSDFAYKTNIGIWSFIISSVLALAVALISVSYHSYKSVTANPVDSIKHE